MNTNLSTRTTVALFLSAYLCFLPNISVAGLKPAWVDHGPLKVAASNRSLEFEDGTPFIWIGDTAWALHQNLSRQDVRLYLDNAKAAGFTVVQLFSANRWALDQFRNYYGDTPYINEDPAEPNPAYWSHTRWVIQEAARRGLYIYLVYGSPSRKDEGMPFAKTPQQAYDYGFGVGSALRGSPNLLWAGGMDNDPTDAQKLAPMGAKGWHAMAEGINDGVANTPGYDEQSDYSHTLMTFHVNGQNISMPYFHDAPWLDFNMGQLGIQEGNGNDRVLVSRIIESYSRKPEKPVFSLEPWYENNTWRKTPVNDYEIRIQAYQSLLAGAAGFTYGNKRIWGMGRPSAKDRDDWKKALSDPGRLQMRHLNTFLSDHPQFKHPDLKHQLVVASEEDLHKTERLKKRISAAYNTAMNRGYVYSPEGKPFTVDLDALKGAECVASWFHPATGESTPANVPNRGQVKMSPPTLGTDWLLILSR